jgi:NADPH-dependent 2,4-dienoyl-CoA reductase/sulfur reductase-like enzyme
MNDTDCRLLVVGDGPTGLVLAAELLIRGSGTRIINKGRTTSEERQARGTIRLT